MNFSPESVNHRFITYSDSVAAPIMSSECYRYWNNNKKVDLSILVRVCVSNLPNLILVIANQFIR